MYQHPLAYLLGLEGIALLRAWAGDHDREFTEARLAEMRRLLADPAEIDRILKDGASRARAIAVPVMDEVKKRVGFIS